MFLDSFIEFLNPFISLAVNVIIIVLVFLYVVKPLLNYFIVNREIENRKKLAREYQEAKRDAEAARAERIESSLRHVDFDDESDDSMVDEMAELANKSKMREQFAQEGEGDEPSEESPPESQSTE